MRTILWFLATAVLSPLLFLTIRKKRAHPTKILVIQVGKMGDLMNTTPLLRAMKTSFPHAAVHVLCRGWCAPVLIHNDAVDGVLPWEGSRIALMRRIRSEGYDIVINGMPNVYASLMLLWSGAPVRIHTDSTRHGVLMRCTRWFSTCSILYRKGKRTYDHYMELAAAAGAKSVPEKMEYVVTPEERRKVIAWLKERGIDQSKEPYAVFGVQPGNRVKEWPMEYFAEVATMLGKEMKLPVLFSAIDAQATRAGVAMAKPPARAIDGSGLTLRELGALLEGSALFVGVDTGPLYIATAVGSGVAAIVGPSFPPEQLPKPGKYPGDGANVVHILPPPGSEPWLFVADSPRTATEDMLRCIRETTPEMAMEAIKRILM